MAQQVTAHALLSASANRPLHKKSAAPSEA